jgi:hypothetical protein
LVLQLVEVVPAGSMSRWGFVVVDVPPENQVPLNSMAGALAAALKALISRADSVRLPLPSAVRVLRPPKAPLLLN